MSKQDSHFFNNFSLVLGVLFAVTIGLFALARHVGAENQGAKVTDDPRYVASVEERLQPVARVAVAGQDNSALKIESTAAAQPAAAVPANGTEAYETACAACHGAGIAGAPKVGDKAAWGPRIAQGKETLYNHALHGFSGKTGVMPAKGGRADWPDDLIKQAVDHIVELNK
ncbi:MAG TPA: c-type cytochrome [Steroidobacteraceae bacterium]|nr:c-type cytochrome [Steroidobacteraceae bacterium]